MDLLAEDRVLLADGAIGTNFQDMGIDPGVAPEEWVLEAPERVRELHRRFAEAGADLVLTCSFGATTPRLADGPLAGRVTEVNVRAAELAREAVGDEGLVAGSIGPTGQLVESPSVRSRASSAPGCTRSRHVRLSTAGLTCSCWRRSSRSRSALGDRGRPGRQRAPARGVVQLRPGDPDDDGAQPH